MGVSAGMIITVLLKYIAGIEYAYLTDNLLIDFSVLAIAYNIGKLSLEIGMVTQNMADRYHNSVVLIA